MLAFVVRIAVAAACSGGGETQLDFEPSPSTDRTGDDERRIHRLGDRPVAPAATGEITILADSARPLDRRLFGTNVPAWLGPDRLADPAFLAATMALGTTLLRFPGGSWSNGYDWLACERGVEPDCFATWAARPSDFVELMEATGLPGVWTASFSGTAEEAAAAVAFFNGDVDDEPCDRRRRGGPRLADGRRVGSPAGRRRASRPGADRPVGGRQRGLRRQAGGRSGLCGVRVGGRVDVRRHPVHRG